MFLSGADRQISGDSGGRRSRTTCTGGSLALRRKRRGGMGGAMTGLGRG